MMFLSVILEIVCVLVERGALACVSACMCVSDLAISLGSDIV